MKRREFITLLGGAAAWPTAVWAQQASAVRTVAMLQPLAADDPEAQLRATVVRQRLQELGWTVGRNLRIEHRWATADKSRIQSYAAEVVKLSPDVILAGTTPVVAALREQTRAIPIVFLQVVDPVSAGLITNLARPGGNLTGITNFEFTMGGKWVETLKEITPYVGQLGIIYNPNTAPYAPALTRSVAAAAPSFAVEAVDTPVQDSAEIERAIDTLSRISNGGLIVLPDATTLFHRHLIISRTAEKRLPAIYPFRYFTTDGGLISYGVDALAVHQQAASYVDRILRGAKPEDLPVEAPNKFELVINLKTAKALGLSVPPTLLARADEVIE